MATKKQKKVDSGGPLQLTFLAPKSEWRPPQVSELPSWADSKFLSIDCETRDPGLAAKLGPGVRRGGYIVGVSFTLHDGKSQSPSYYLPFRHEGGDNIDEGEALRYLRGNAKAFRGEYVGANLGYDLDYLWEENIVSPEVEFYRDIQNSDPLIYELHDSYSLQNIGKRCGVESKDRSLLEEAAAAHGLSVGGGLWRLPARYVGPYAERDTSSPLEIYFKQWATLTKEELWGVFDLESRVTPVLVKMRRRGVRVNEEKLSKIEEWSLKEEIDALALVKHETGYDIGVGNIWKPQSLAVPLENIGMRLNKTTGGAPNIDKDVLAAYDHPVTRAIAHARKVNKLRTTFADSVRRFMINGRIHCTFNQMRTEDENRPGVEKGARYGRLSCIEPNMQQQPSRDDFASMWRSIYEPEEGMIWGALDYSQQEPRWTTHFAALLDLPRAREAAQRYREDPTTDNHTMMTILIHGEQILKADKDVFKKCRGNSKLVFLGLCYGEGGAKLCRDLGLPTRWALSYGRGRDRRTEFFEHRFEAFNRKADLGGDGYAYEAAGPEGQEIIDNFKEKVPYVPDLANRVKKAAMARGYIKTVMGRRLHFPQRDDGTYDWAHKALNRLIQGSSADQTKKAVVDLDREGYYLQLQVHDEIDGSFKNKEEALCAGKLMQDSILTETKPLVPFLVDVECGSSWGDSME